VNGRQVSCRQLIRDCDENWHAVCEALDVIQTWAQNVTLPLALAKTNKMGRPGLHSSREVNGLQLHFSLAVAPDPLIVSLLMQAY
jgi:hypothetical protein